MRIVRTWQNVAAADRGAAAAIGNFDGVHRGHGAVIDIARRAAGGAPLGVVTFEPHPRQYFRPDGLPFRLMNREARATELEHLGVDILYELPFDDRLAGLGPERFVGDVLHHGLGLRRAIVGADFRFGADRAGDAAALRDLCAKSGIAVEIAELVRDDVDEISSTAIRRALSAGCPEEAARMLGHLHRIEGPVILGDRRGRTLGWPTANMTLAGLHPPRFGVYAVEVEVRTGSQSGVYGGVASIGTRPTFGENAPNIETFIFDFAGDLYGQHLSVGLITFLRGEARYDSADALVAQMEKDGRDSRRILATRQ